MDSTTLILELQKLNVLAQRRANFIDSAVKGKEQDAQWKEAKTEFFLNDELTPHVNYIIKYIVFYDQSNDKR